MNVSASRNAFEKHLSERGLQLSSLKPEQGVDAVLSFYSTQRARGCSLEEDGDMLLFQWGTYDWGDGEHFSVDVTRQFITGSEGDDDIFQLSLTFRFQPTKTLRELGDGNRWCRRPDQVPEFKAFIRASKAYATAATLKPIKVVLDFEGI